MQPTGPGCDLKDAIRSSCWIGLKWLFVARRLEPLTVLVTENSYNAVRLMSEADDKARQTYHLPDSIFFFSAIWKKGDMRVCFLLYIIFFFNFRWKFVIWTSQCFGDDVLRTANFFLVTKWSATFWASGCDILSCSGVPARGTARLIALITILLGMVLCKTGKALVCLFHAPVLSARKVLNHRNSSRIVTLPRLSGQFSDTLTVPQRQILCRKLLRDDCWLPHH